MTAVKLLLLLHLFVMIMHGDYLNTQTFMDIRKVEARYGNQKFSASSFRGGTSAQRAKMVFSLIRQRTFIGKTPLQIKEELGDFTGYFFSDNVPAYLIEEGWKEGKDTWQVVFLLDDLGQVNDVRVQKNCCPKK